MERTRVAWMDSLRGIACSVVLLVHALSVFPSVGSRLSGCGKIGVWLLFVISGYWLITPYLKGETMNGTDALKFYIKRVTRIYPVFILTVIVSVLIGYLSLNAGIKHLLLQEGLEHFWAIPVEFKIYLLLPPLLMVLLYFYKRSKPSLIIALAGLAFILALCFPFTRYRENSISFLWYAPVFLMGMITAVICSYLSGDVREKRYDLLILAILALMILSVPWVREILFKIEPDSYLMNKYLFFGLGWSLIIIFITRSYWIRNILDGSRLLGYIGKISYSLYLVHYVILRYSERFISDPVIRFALVIVLSFVIAALLERFVERPANRYARKICDGMSKTSATSAAGYVLMVLGLIFVVISEVRTKKYML